MRNATIVPVVMCGGSGTRLWPASRASSPKQFIPLFGGQSTFQEAMLRVKDLAGAGRPIVVAGAAHHRLIAQQLEALGIEAEILIEPMPRDSAAAIAAAAAWIDRRDGAAVAVVVAADHHIPDHDAFRRAMVEAAVAAAQGQIVTLGVQPTHAATAYGYIKPGAGTEGVRKVERFVEKPDAATAETYIAAGYLWNSGAFVARADVILQELEQFAPAVAQAARAAVDGARPIGPYAVRLGAAFERAPTISIDYAVMEKTQRAAVLPVSFEWSDLGAWKAVKDALEADTDGNVIQGDAVVIETRDTLLRVAPGMVAAAVGIRGMAVVVERDAVLVCDLAQSQSVKRVVDALKARPEPTEAAEPGRERGLSEFAADYEHWLHTAALPLWWTLGADHRSGGFHDWLDQRGAAGAVPRRARCQARQIFVYASAGRLGWRGPFEDAARHGLSYFRERYRMDSGLFRTLVGPDGAPLDDTAWLYDQAFALLALATAHRIELGGAELRTEANQLAAAIEGHFGHAEGGYREAGKLPFQSNPQMHLLEACLAWIEIDDAARWRDTAARIVRLALDRFIDADGRFLREYFDARWLPAEGEAGRIVEPGHQFEWAWLLDRWGELSGDSEARAAAAQLFASGVRGCEPDDRVIDQLDDRLAPLKETARLWPQTERLKAALRLSRSAAPDAQDLYLDQALSACRGLWRFLDVPTRGLWRDKQRPDGGFVVEPAPTSSFYHIVGGIEELRRHCGGAGS